jgi:hypothetical protein
MNVYQTNVGQSNEVAQISDVEIVRTDEIGMHPMQFPCRWIEKILKPDLLRSRENR